MEEDEDNFCRFGTALEPLVEDEIPSKKPIAVEDQIVADSNGKRRFHGAFTGGFSAGFWNTVGSLEGWKPQSFKSSRAEKAERSSQRPTDFMDDEDLGEFGIAPQRVQTTEDFTRQEPGSSMALDRKRKLEQQTTGPIPGVPVLHQLLRPPKDNIAIRLLKKMGWKEGQGIGARQSRKEKKITSQRNARERYVMKMYGCDMGPGATEPKENFPDEPDIDEESDLSDDEITFAPDDFEPFICSLKNNTFGLGYEGLSRDPVLQKQHINLFGTFEVMGKDNKKLSIRGQAFGVGALEEEDEDIYARDDMARYDFTLGGKAKAKANDKSKQQQEMGVLEGFHASQNAVTYRKKIFTVTLPAGFKPRNWAVRKTRFEPLDDDRASVLRTKDEYKSRGLGRHDLDPDQRGKILGESSKTVGKQDEKDPDAERSEGKKKTYLERINEKYRSKDKAKESAKVLELIASKMDNFTKGEVLGESLEEGAKKEGEKVQSDAMKITKDLDKTPTVFKPFLANDPKQDRYDKFLEQNLRNDDEITKFLGTIQPLNMSDWDREMEKKEFIQARNIYRPLKGLMSDRFVSETSAVAERTETETVKKSQTKVEIVRTKSIWKPAALLCKGFNIAEPFGGTMEDEKKAKRKPRFSVFDYLETSVNSKENFSTPVIFPTKAEKPKPIISQNETIGQPTSRVSSKELFASEISTSTIEWNRVTENKPKSVEPVPLKRNDKNKTPLEKKVDELRTKHPSEKKDLFKAIFDSSSEDEDQPEAPKPTDPQLLGTEAHKDIFATMKQSAAEINILRNTSPPRGIFANLFTKKPDREETKQETVQSKSPPQEEKTDKSNSNSAKVAEKSDSIPGQELTKSKSDVPIKIAFKPRNERMKESVEEEIVDFYGPKVPDLPPPPPAATSMATESVTNVDQVDEKLLQLLKKNKKEVKILEKWVEKSDTGSSDRKKKKKDKDRERDKKKKLKKHKKDKKRHKDKK